MKHTVLRHNDQRTGVLNPPALSGMKHTETFKNPEITKGHVLYGDATHGDEINGDITYGDVSSPTDDHKFL